MSDLLNKTSVKENIEWTNFRWHNAPDVDKKRVLLIGDSIVAGHGAIVHEWLKDDYCIDYMATAKCVSDVDFMFELDYMLSRHEYELVIFNNGLHGFEIEDQVYIEHLENVLSELNSRVKNLAWRNSTPVRSIDDLNCFREDRNPRVILRNNAGAAIAEKLALPVIDLYTPMSEQVELFAPDGIHYNDRGQKSQAGKIAEFITDRLQ